MSTCPLARRWFFAVVLCAQLCAVSYGGCGDWLARVANLFRKPVPPVPVVLEPEEQIQFDAWMDRWSSKALGVIYGLELDEAHAAVGEVPESVQQKLLVAANGDALWKQLTSFGVKLRDVPPLDMYVNYFDFMQKQTHSPTQVELYQCLQQVKFFDSAQREALLAPVRKKLAVAVQWERLKATDNPMLRVEVHAQHVRLPEGRKLPILRREKDAKGKPYLVVGVPQRNTLKVVTHLDRHLEEYYADLDPTKAVVQGSLYPDGTFVLFESETEKAFWFAIKTKNPASSAHAMPLVEEELDPNSESDPDLVASFQLGHDPRALLPVKLALRDDGTAMAAPYLDIASFRQWLPLDAMEEYWANLPASMTAAVLEEFAVNAGAMNLGLPLHRAASQKLFRHLVEKIPDEFLFDRLFRIELRRL